MIERNEERERFMKHAHSRLTGLISTDHIRDVAELTRLVSLTILPSIILLGKSKLHNCLSVHSSDNQLLPSVEDGILIPCPPLERLMPTCSSSCRVLIIDGDVCSVPANLPPALSWFHEIKPERVFTYQAKFLRSFIQDHSIDLVLCSGLIGRLGLVPGVTFSIGVPLRALQAVAEISSSTVSSNGRLVKPVDAEWRICNDGLLIRPARARCSTLVFPKSWTLGKSIESAVLDLVGVVLDMEISTRFAYACGMRLDPGYVDGLCGARLEFIQCYSPASKNLEICSTVLADHPSGVRVFQKPRQRIIVLKFPDLEATVNSACASCCRICGKVSPFADLSTPIPVDFSFLLHINQFCGCPMKDLEISVRIQGMLTKFRIQDIPVMQIRGCDHQLENKDQIIDTSLPRHATAFASLVAAQIYSLEISALSEISFDCRFSLKSILKKSTSARIELGGLLDECRKLLAPVSAPRSVTVHQIHRKILRLIFALSEIPETSPRNDQPTVTRKRRNSDPVQRATLKNFSTSVDDSHPTAPFIRLQSLTESITAIKKDAQLFPGFYSTETLAVSLQDPGSLAAAALYSGERILIPIGEGGEDVDVDFWGKGFVEISTLFFLIDSLSTTTTFTPLSSRSGSEFRATSNFRFLLKSLKPAEEAFLKENIHEISEHQKNSTCSFLVPIRAAFTLKSESIGVVPWVVMDLIGGDPSDLEISTFDLKGLNRKNSSDESLRNVLLGYRISTWKFLSALEKDIAFLTSLNVMDYSLLVRIPRKALLAATPEGPRTMSLHVLECAVIDWFRPFTWEKRLESAVKSAADEPTVMRPNEYAERFLRNIGGFFAEFINGD